MYGIIYNTNIQQNKLYTTYTQNKQHIHKKDISFCLAAVASVLLPSRVTIDPRGVTIDP
jgi:hypothetical protein